MQYDIKSHKECESHEVFGLAAETHNNRMESYPDQQLAALVRDGDPDAFLELTSRYMTLIRAKAAPFHGTMLEADDLCQEGLLGLLDAVRSFREDGGASFRTYAGTCITNRIIMAYRWAAGRKNLPLNNFVPLNEEGTSCGAFAGEEVNPEKMLVEEEDLLLLKQFISRGLSKMERQVLMVYLGGYSYKEIADSLRITSKAADNALQRVRRKLKEPF